VRRLHRQILVILSELISTSALPSALRKHEMSVTFSSSLVF